MRGQENNIVGRRNYVNRDVEAWTLQGLEESVGGGDLG